MSKGPVNPRQTPADWIESWQAVCRLADASDSALQELRVKATDAAALRTRASDREHSQAVEAQAAQMERDLEEIERAKRSLREAEPALQNWPLPTEHRRRQRPPVSVMLLVGLIWTCTAVVVVAALAAMRSLL